MKGEHFFCLLNCREEGKANWKVLATWMHFHPLLVRYLRFLFSLLTRDPPFCVIILVLKVMIHSVQWSPDNSHRKYAKICVPIKQNVQIIQSSKSIGEHIIVQIIRDVRIREGQIIRATLYFVG